MAGINWRIQGIDISTCNCAWGCPCQFMSLPTQGHCQAAVAIRVDHGHFGDTPLDGLAFGGLFKWPGPIHEGNGEVQPIVDERASDAQRAALLKIMSGEETEAGATIFNVFAATYARVHPPLFAAIEVACDPDARDARVVVPGVLELQVEPIRNPVTGEPVRVRIDMPAGFEFDQAEAASSRVRTLEAPFPLAWESRHAHLAHIDMSGAGVAHPRAA